MTGGKTEEDKNSCNMKWVEGEKIILRPMDLSDTDLIIQWRNQDYVRRNFIFQELFTVEGHHQWFHTMIETGKAVQYMIYEKKGPENLRPVGSTYLRDIDYNLGKAEYGIFIGEKDACGRGYGTEAAKLMTEYAFHTLKLHKVFLRLRSDNKAAARSYEKAGFMQIPYPDSENKDDSSAGDIIFMEIIHRKNL